MHKQLEQVEKHSALMVEFINNAISGIKDGLAILANAISNVCPQ